jgi:DNA-binding SARP family transcriptional activator
VLIRLHTLGPLSVICDGTDIEELNSKRLLCALLVYLAVERQVTRDQLMGALWELKEPARARHSLNQALYELRKVLGTSWLRTPGDRFIATPLLEIDVIEFQRLGQAGKRDAALSLYQGPFLEHFLPDLPAFDHWAAAHRASAARLARSLFRQSVDDLLAAGDLRSAVEAARRWVDIDPLDDEAQHRLIELLAASGDRSTALRHFDEYRIMLAQDDLRPLDETVELIAGIRRGELPVVSEAAGPARPATAGPAAAAPTSPSTEVVQAASEAPEETGTERWGGAATGGPRLVRVLEDGKTAESFPLTRMRTRIGRDDGDIRFPDDPGMAPVHATIVMRTSRSGGADEGIRFVLRDESTSTGVYVRLRSAWPLQPGDEFLAGHVRLRLEDETTHGSV